VPQAIPESWAVPGDRRCCAAVNPGGSLVMAGPGAPVSRAQGIAWTGRPARASSWAGSRPHSFREAIAGHPRGLPGAYGTFPELYQGGERGIFLPGFPLQVKPPTAGKNDMFFMIRDDK
jgi:hypothetical protein